jgi:hypothetical protein
MDDTVYTVITTTCLFLFLFSVGIFILLFMKKRGILEGRKPVRLVTPSQVKPPSAV